uniref:Box C/D snoRNA protein 1 n=1 Tax=Leptobrachium leishanense TaxID=445787 RepID=A0A8C5PSS9_9ANUR
MESLEAAGSGENQARISQPKRKMCVSSCGSCGEAEAKYRCPRCLRYSCSLPCVKRHKVDTGCTGVRDKSQFVPIGGFNEMHLLSDYRFLEDAGRLVDGASRDRKLPRQSSSKYLNFLKNRARKLDIELKILPIGFTKRRMNSTYFHRRDQRFYWHLKLSFPQSQAEYTEKGVPDNKSLHKILERYIDPAVSEPVIRQRLRLYTSRPSDVKVFMVLDSPGRVGSNYVELDLQKSLLDNLRNKDVVEFPTLCVVLGEFAKDLMPSAS